MILVEKIEKNSLILMWPLTINGRSNRLDDPSYDYHITWKYFGETDMDVSEIIEMVEGMPIKKPTSGGKVCLEPIVLSGKDGKQAIPVLYVCSMPKAMFDLKAKLDAIWPDTFPVYKPHITVEPETFMALSSGDASVDDLKIIVHDLCLKKGGDTIKVFKHSAPLFMPRTLDAFGIPATQSV